jgi:hypothetical protein
MKYRFALMTQTQIGRLFGVSSHEVGRWLEAAGLRVGSKPSRLAHQEGYCDTAPSRGQGYCWAWRPEKTVEALVRAGHRPVSPPPLDLVEPPGLAGPFTRRDGDGGVTEILSSDGSVAVVVLGERNAGWMLRLLNTAHQFKVLPKPAHPPAVSAE